MDRQERIDWSKAPEDAQFWNPDTQNDWECWLKYEDLSWWFKRVGAECRECREWREAVVDDATVRVMVARSPSTNNEHHDHKEGEGVKWDPGVDLPPAGEVVDYKRMTDDQWIGPAKAFHITRMGVCFVEYEDHGGWDKCSDPTRFRPAKSHRDKVIEALCEIANKPSVSSRNVSIECSAAQRAIIEAIADSGLVSLAGDPQ